VISERAWVTPVGLAVVGLVVIANAVGDVGYGLTGDALFVTTGVASYVVCAVLFLLWVEAPRLVVMVLVLGMSTAATLTHHGDPTSSGGIGLYLGMAFAPLRLDVRRAAAVCAAGVLIFDLHLLLDAENRSVFTLVVTGGAVFFFILGLLLRREEERRVQVTQLLAELERRRESEKVAAALSERSRLAREMHDVLAHTLSGLVLQLDGLRLLSNARGADGDVRQGVDRAHRLARAGLHEARQAITALRGESVPGPDLLPELVAEHREATGRSCELVVEGAPRPVAADSGLTLYRAAQEALSNVRKHARDADVRVRLTWSDEEVVLVVEDTGLPVAAGSTARSLSPDAESRTSGFGLTGMAERAQLAGGRLQAGHTGHGFRVELRLPAAAPGPVPARSDA
jgi:signal transduction histidine kinase